MELGYILAIVFAVIWLAFKVFEVIQKRKAKGNFEQYENDRIGE